MKIKIIKSVTGSGLLVVGNSRSPIEDGLGIGNCGLRPEKLWVVDEQRGVRIEK